MAREIIIHRTLDLKGEVCPYTFIKCKLVVEEMQIGEVLRVIVDHKAAIENIPRSMKDEGHTTLRVEKINDTDWQVVIKKEGE